MSNKPIRDAIRTVLMMAGLPVSEETPIRVHRVPPIDDLDPVDSYSWDCVIKENMTRVGSRLYAIRGNKPSQQEFSRSAMLTAWMYDNPLANYVHQAISLFRKILPVPPLAPKWAYERKSEKTLLNDAAIATSLAVIDMNINDHYEEGAVHEIPSAEECVDAVLANIKDQILHDVIKMRDSRIMSWLYDINN